MKTRELPREEGIRLVGPNVDAFEASIAPGRVTKDLIDKTLPKLGTNITILGL